MSLGKSRKIINLKKESGEISTVHKQFDTVNAASKGSMYGTNDSRGVINQDGIKVIDYVPNHNQAQFAEISAKMNHKKIPSHYT